MKITNESLLDLFRAPGRCEFCKILCDAREPHHASAKGMGGGGRLDIRCNILAVGRSRPYPVCPCHRMIQEGRERADVVLAKIAQREGTTAEAILDVLALFRRIPKDPFDLLEYDRDLSTAGAKKLFLKECKLAVSMGAIVLR